MARRSAALFARIAVALFAFAAHAAAQDADEEATKKRILDKVRERLAAERSAILKKVEKVLDEELAKGPGAAEDSPEEYEKAIREIEKRLRVLDDQREQLQAELAKAKRMGEDGALRKEAQRDGPHDGEEAQAMFDEGLSLHEKDKNYAESVKLFKKIFYNFPGTGIAATSAYNVACGYALWGKTVEALDWLETAVRSGFEKFDHMRQDPDLNSLRDEKRYKKLLTDR
jgi:tetratricopeptide (TPR) repeat protein